MSFLGKSFVFLSALAICGLALADSEDDYESKQWQEIEVQLPAAPKDETLQAFYVTAASDNQFLIDLATLSVGQDGVVRYVLLVLTPEGGRNVTFEGMRCETRQHRIYASGRRDGAWSRSRNNTWTRIQEAYVNRQYAALFLDYFCPGGMIVQDVAEAKEALRRGSHPYNRRQ